MSGYLDLQGGTVWALQCRVTPSVLTIDLSWNIQQRWVLDWSDERVDLCDVAGLAVTDTCLAVLDHGDRSLVTFGPSSAGSAGVLSPEIVVPLSDMLNEPHGISKDEDGRIFICGDGGDTIVVFDLSNPAPPLERIITGAGPLGIMSDFVVDGGRFVTVSHVFREWHAISPHDTKWTPLEMLWVHEPLLASASPSGPVLLGRDCNGAWIIEASGEFAKLEAVARDEDVVGFLALDENRFAVLKENDELDSALVLLSRHGHSTRVDKYVEL